MMRRLAEIRSTELRRKLMRDGYAYMDENKCVCADLPARGWYISVCPDGSVVKTRLTDRPEPDVRVHVRTDRPPFPVGEHR